MDLPTVDIGRHFDDCFTFIDSARRRGGCVLVHCNAGVSRAASIVIAYVMYKKNMTYTEALEMVKAQRPVVRPNDGFAEQLQNYQPKTNTEETLE